MRGAKCDICGGLFPRAEMGRLILPFRNDGGRTRRRVCAKHWKPIEATWWEMLGEQAGPRPNPPMPIEIAPTTQQPRKWRPEEIS